MRKGLECEQARRRWAPKSTDSEGGSSRKERGNPRTNSSEGKEGRERPSRILQKKGRRLPSSSNKVTMKGPCRIEKVI